MRASSRGDEPKGTASGGDRDPLALLQQQKPARQHNVFLSSFLAPALPSEPVTLAVQWAQPLRVPKSGAQRLRGQHHAALQQQQQHLHS